MKTRSILILTALLLSAACSEEKETTERSAFAEDDFVPFEPSKPQEISYIYTLRKRLFLELATG